MGGKYGVRVCFFSDSAFDALKPRERRDYEKVKAAVLKDGRFSAFDASANPAIARIFDALGGDPSVEYDRENSAYPWVLVRARADTPAPTEAD